MARQQHSLVILDDYADIARKHFQHVPNLIVTVYQDTLSVDDPSELPILIERLRPHSIISSMRERTAFPASLLSQLPNLRLLLNSSARNSSIDSAYCKEHGIVVSGTKSKRPVHLDSSSNPIPPSSPVHPIRTINPTSGPFSSTTQHTLSLLLALTSRIPTDSTALHTPPYTAWQSGPSVLLAGKTLAILGLGKLGVAFARVAILALGMRVTAWSSSLTQSKADDAAVAVGLPAGSFEAVDSKQTLFETADVLSVHYVLSDRSRGLVGRAELESMKPSALLVNSARGPIIDEQALLDVLRRGRIAGAALDVFWEREPLPAESVWRREKWGTEGRARVVLSPHLGYVNEDTMEIWYGEQAADVERWIAGEEVELSLT